MCDEGGLPPASARAAGWRLGCLKKLRCFFLRLPWVGRGERFPSELASAGVLRQQLEDQVGIGRAGRCSEAAWSVTLTLGLRQSCLGLKLALRFLSGSKKGGKKYLCVQKQFVDDDRGGYWNRGGCSLSSAVCPFCFSPKAADAGLPGERSWTI